MRSSNVAVIGVFFMVFTIGFGVVTHKAHICYWREYVPAIFTHGERKCLTALLSRTKVYHAFPMSFSPARRLNLEHFVGKRADIVKYFQSKAFLEKLKRQLRVHWIGCEVCEIGEIPYKGVALYTPQYRIEELFQDIGYGLRCLAAFGTACVCSVAGFPAGYLDSDIYEFSQTETSSGFVNLVSPGLLGTVNVYNSVYQLLKPDTLETRTGLEIPGPIYFYVYKKLLIAQYERTGLCKQIASCSEIGNLIVRYRGVNVQGDFEDFREYIKAYRISREQKM